MMLQHPHVYPVSMQHTIYSTEQQMIIEPLTSGDVVMTAQQSSYCITQPELNDEPINQTTIQEIYDQAQFNLPRADLEFVGLRGSELYSELINQTTMQDIYAQPPLTLPTADPDHIGMYGSELYSESINQTTIQESYAQPPPLSTASHIPICLPAHNPPSPCLRMSAPTPIAIIKAETTVGQPNIVTTASTYASSDTLITPAIRKDPLVTPDPIVTASLTALTSVDVKNSVTKTNPTQVLKVPNASDKMSSIYPSLTSEASTPVISSGTVSDNQKPRYSDPLPPYEMHSLPQAYDHANPNEKNKSIDKEIVDGTIKKNTDKNGLDKKSQKKSKKKQTTSYKCIII